MAEPIGIGESVTVEVTRASPFSGVASAVTSTGASASQFPMEYMVVIFGAVVAIAFVFLALRKHSMLKRGFSPRKLRMRMVEAEHSIKNLSGRRGRLLRSMGIAGAIGFAGIVLTGTGVVWALAAVVFYYEFFLKNGK
jgi:hypothetical protein